MRFDLTPEERVHYRDRLRTARYAALADAEGFSEICFVVEALGMRMLKQQATLGAYKGNLVALAGNICVMKTLANDYPGCFSQFDALCETLNKARNDAMHTGAYARHATYAAIELCIHLEEAVMAGPVRHSQQEDLYPMKVQDHMVKEVVSLEGWHPVAYARKLMLMHSFSFLPVFVDGRWALVSELAIAKYLQVSLQASHPHPKPDKARKDERNRRLALPIHTAINPSDPEFPGYCEPQTLELCDSPVELQGNDAIKGLFDRIDTSKPTLWLVLGNVVPNMETQRRRLEGVLTPFELM